VDDKAKAEAGVLLAERWIMARLRNERFTTLAEANARIRELLEWINARAFKKIDSSRKALFEALDRPALRPLPSEPYEFATWRSARLNMDYHIEVRADHHFYSAPYHLVGETVEVRLSSSSVEIFFSHRRVASHVRSYTPGFTTDPAHMPESHRRHAQWTPSRIVSWAKQTGPATAELTEAIMAARPHPEQGFRSCLGIIRLGERYGTDRLEAACRRALAVKTYSYKSVSSILSCGLDKKPLPEPTPVRAHPSHPNLRGPEYYE